MRQASVFSGSRSLQYLVHYVSSHANKLSTMNLVECVQSVDSLLRICPEVTLSAANICGSSTVSRVFNSLSRNVDHLSYKHPLSACKALHAWCALGLGCDDVDGVAQKLIQVVTAHSRSVETESLLLCLASMINYRPTTHECVLRDRVLSFSLGPANLLLAAAMKVMAEKSLMSLSPRITMLAMDLLSVSNIFNTLGEEDLKTLVTILQECVLAVSSDLTVVDLYHCLMCVYQAGVAPHPGCMQTLHTKLVQTGDKAPLLHPSMALTLLKIFAQWSYTAIHESTVICHVMDSLAPAVKFMYLAQVYELLALTDVVHYFAPTKLNRMKKYMFGEDKRSNGRNLVNELADRVVALESSICVTQLGGFVCWFGRAGIRSPKLWSALARKTVAFRPFLTKGMLCKIAIRMCFVEAIHTDVWHAGQEAMLALLPTMNSADVWTCSRAIQYFLGWSTDCCRVPGEPQPLHAALSVLPTAVALGRRMVELVDGGNAKKEEIVGVSSLMECFAALKPMSQDSASMLKLRVAASQADVGVDFFVDTVL